MAIFSQIFAISPFKSSKIAGLATLIWVCHQIPGVYFIASSEDYSSQSKQF
jgi:hypothetical protein